jgi:uncharacterized membrane protein
MAGFEKWIEVDVPVRTAYNQWTQFEEFPRFMEGVERVVQHGDSRVSWRASIFGKVEEWDSHITDQTPDKRVAWESTSGAQNNGVVSFQPIGPSRTRVGLHISYEPQGILENIGDKLGLLGGAGGLLGLVLAAVEVGGAAAEGVRKVASHLLPPLVSGAARAPRISHAVRRA